MHNCFSFISIKNKCKFKKYIYYIKIKLFYYLFFGIFYYYNKFKKKKKIKKSSYIIK